MNAEITETIRFAQEAFARLLAKIPASGVTVEHYQRYLSMQYHFTRGVQRDFMDCASHPDLVKRKPLRRFLFEFANEEEQHYLLAANDLAQLDLPILAEPFEVTLWHAYFRTIARSRPFVRLGATCVLENISSGAARPYVKQALTAPFLRKENTKFLVLHQHELIPHGRQVLDALEAAHLSTSHVQDLRLGAIRGALLYLRMAAWALCTDEFASWSTSSGEEHMSLQERDDIERVKVEELYVPAVA